MWQEESDDSSNDSEDDIMKAAHDAEESENIELSHVEGAQAGSNHGSDYEHSEVESHESEEEKSSVSSSSEENSDSTPPRAKKNNSRRLDEDTRRLLEENNYLRRSSRCKTQEVEKMKAEVEDSESGDSEGSWSEGEEPKRKKAKSNKKKSPSYKGIRNASRKNVDYTEKDTDEDIDENDVLEWEEEKPIPSDSLPVAPVETIERVIKYRIGVIGATGSHTTCYNSEKNDPLANLDKTRTEDQYLIKWVGWSHLHNTWESESSLMASGVGGIKKVHNFVKKQKQIDLWRRTADKEYVEFFDCEQFMNEQLCEEYTKVERIVAHQVSREKSSLGASGTEYFVKWNGLSYSDCTWEDEKLLPAERLTEYHRRIENFKQPNKNAAALRRRPKFVKLEKTPDFLREGGEGNYGRDLRDYQLEGLNWMLHAWCKNNSCILADEMGLGKTIQSISFLSALTHRYEVYGPFLVVVPLSTMAAWQREFVNWASDMNVVVYMGDSSSREQIRQFEWYNPCNKKLKLNACLTTYEILLKDKSFLGSFEWAALAVDEAHRLKNDESLLYKCLSQFSCDHRLLITGTPLQNSIKELWALLHFIMPDKFESWEEFEYDHNDKDHKGISALHRKLEPYLLRRVKKDVEKSLPPKLEQILRVDMTAQQKQYYKWILTKNYRELSKGVKGSINGFVNLVMELKKCCNHASLVRHYDYHEGEAQARLQQLLKSSGKLILLDKLLCRLRETGHRVLIFSQMVMMLDILQEYLQLRRFPSQRLDGSMRADLRKQALDHFNAEGSTDFCFLLSTRAGGLGINLATADTVIIFDSDWNPQNDLQAMSRAHRIGQTRQVNIYRLVTRASVEEEIVERAKRKLVLDHLVIQRMDTSGRTVLSKTNAGSVPFDKHELNNILKFGAAELFKESEGEEQEPEVDIDRILLGAETRDAEEENVGPMDLLSSFKYANFVIDEERDVAEAAAQKRDDWDQIIPEDQRAKVEEEERQKDLAGLELAPRNRNKQFTERNVTAEDDDGDNSSDSETDASKRRKKKAWGDFSSAEIKKFVRAFKKFAMPLERLEALAQEAELEDRSTSEIQKITEALLDGCKKCEDDYNSKKENVKEKDKKDGDKVKDKGPTFKFAGVIDVNVKQFRKMHTDLKPLHDALSGPSSSDFKAPPRARPQKGWDVEWSSVDDSALLKGVYKYGMGSWESIKMDPDLGLAEKIFLKDKVKKPQKTNAQQRVDYLLKLMNTKPATTNNERKRKAPEHPNNVVEKKSRNVKFTKEWLEEQLFLLKINKSAYAHDLDNTNDRPFTQCVKMMRSVQKYIKRLAQGDTESDLAKCLCRLGDNCRDQLGLMIKKRPETNLEKWYNYLWIFLSRFVSKEPNEMLLSYRELIRAKSKGREHKSKDRVDKTTGREKKAEKEKRSDKEKKAEKEKRSDKEKKDKDKDRGSSKDHKDRKEHKSHRRDKDREKDNHERKDHGKQSSKPKSGHNHEVEREKVLHLSTLSSH
ncbi:unnamed protein product [Auanema sp. JU1783]|nr:unnamed protein product [Auanema sp. JU1783]